MYEEIKQSRTVLPSTLVAGSGSIKNNFSINKPFINTKQAPELDIGVSLTATQPAARRDIVQPKFSLQPKALSYKVKGATH